MTLNWDQKNFKEATKALIKTGTKEEANEFILHVIEDFSVPYAARRHPDEIFWIVAETDWKLQNMKRRRSVADYYKILKPLLGWAKFYEMEPEEFPDLSQSFLELINHFHLKRPLPGFLKTESDK